MSKFKLMSVVCVAIAAMLMCAVAEAQPGRGGGGRGGMMMMGGGMGGGGSWLGLLRNEQIQNELELTFEQKEKLQAIGAEVGESMREIFGGLRDLSREERAEKMGELREKMQEQMAKIQGKVEKILDTDQIKRIKQINIQVQGDRALGSDEVLKELKITDAQKKKLEKIAEGLRAEQEKLREGIRERMRDVPRDQMREKFGEIREEIRGKTEKMNAAAEKKVMAVLTSTQKKKLEEMKGKSFEFDRSRGFGGQRGGRGGDRGGRGGARGGRGGGGGGDDGPIR